MIEVHILIPVADNAGITFAETKDDVFAAELDRLFGGSSLLPGLVAGRWVSGGQTFLDHNRVFMVFVNGLIAEGAKIIEAVGFAKSHYEQLAITVRYLGQAEIM